MTWNDGRGYMKRYGGSYEHVAVAERILGRPLPKGAVVHHVDENKSNNDPSNLVICESHAYHALLHARLRAFRATGNPNARKCAYCHEWTDPAIDDVHIKSGAGGCYHRVCERAYQKRTYKRSSLTRREANLKAWVTRRGRLPQEDAA